MANRGNAKAAGVVVGGLRQLLPIHISSIKSVVLPNPTTKQGRCAHTHGREEKHMKHIKGFYRTYGTSRGIKTREQINPQSTVKLLNRKLAKKQFRL